MPLEIAALVSTGADLVGLQEASVTTTHKHVTQRLAQGLARETRVRWYWCWFQSNPHFPLEPDTRAGGGGGPLTEVMVKQARSGQAEFREGLGVLSRLPITRTSVHRQPPRSYEALFCVPPDPLACNAAGFFDSRAILFARVQTGVGAVDFFTTHVAHELTPLSVYTKLLQTRLALRYIDDIASPDGAPDVFVGDFNSAPGSDVVVAVEEDGFVDSFRAAQPTAHGYTGDQSVTSAKDTTTERIDYVWVRPGACRVRVVDSDTYPDKPTLVAGKPLWPSDHHGVVSTLRLC